MYLQALTKLFLFEFVLEDTHYPKRQVSSSIITQAAIGVAAIQSLSFLYGCNVATLQKSVR